MSATITYEVRSLEVAILNDDGRRETQDRTMVALTVRTPPHGAGEVRDLPTHSRRTDAQWSLWYPSLRNPVGLKLIEKLGHRERPTGPSRVPIAARAPGAHSR